MQGAPQPFGSTYTFEVPDTVVEGHEGASLGSTEYLVFGSTLTKLAQSVGLHPVSAVYPATQHESVQRLVGSDSVQKLVSPE